MSCPKRNSTLYQPYVGPYFDPDTSCVPEENALGSPGALVCTWETLSVGGVGFIRL